MLKNDTYRQCKYHFLLKKYNCAKKLMLHGFQHVCHCFSAELDSKDTP